MADFEESRKPGGSVKIVFEGGEKDPFMLVEKPAGLPSATLRDGDEDGAAFIVARLEPRLAGLKCRGRFDFGLLNRLDSETSGLLLFARTQEAYDFLLGEQSRMKIVKRYSALCDRRETTLPSMPRRGFDFSRPPVEFSTYFRPFGAGGREVRPCFEPNPRKRSTKKPYATRILSLSREEGGWLAACEIAAGFRHQIRCHLCMAGFPIRGDAIYNPQNCGGELQLRADGIEFVHPLTGRPFKFSLDGR